MKIIFFGTNNFVIPILDALNKAHEILAVITTPDAPVGRKRELKPTPVAQHSLNNNLNLLRPPTLKDQTLTENLKHLNADLFIVASYGKIIPETILQIPPHGVVNIHPSLLPKYRGPTPVQSALMDGITTTGVTLIQMDKEVDHGPIIAQASYDIMPDQIYEDLVNKLFVLGAKILLETIDDFTTGKLKPTPQDESQTSFTKILTKADGGINWENSAFKIYNHFRAFHQWPGIWTQWNNSILKIIDCSAQKSHSALAQPGVVLEDGSIVCGQRTVLKPQTLQLSGKTPTDLTSFLRGYPNFIGSQLSTNLTPI